MLEIGTRLYKKYNSGGFGPELKITKRVVIRDRSKNTTDILYVVGSGYAYGAHTEEGIREGFVIVDCEATAILNEDA